MRLHQIKVDYIPEQDRLLMLVSTSDGAEVRSWLTRRLVKLLWPLLVKLAEETSPRIAAQANPEARKALLGIEHEDAMSKADFSKPYEQTPRSTPLGEAPLLVARIQTARDPDGRPILTLNPSEGQGMSMTLDPVLLHSYCRLLQAAVTKSDWDMEIHLPRGTASVAEAPETPRVLN